MNITCSALPEALMESELATLLGLNRDQIRYRVEKFSLERSSAKA